MIKLCYSDICFCFVFVFDKGTAIQFLDPSPGDTTAPYTHDTAVYER